MSSDEYEHDGRIPHQITQAISDLLQQPFVPMHPSARLETGSDTDNDNDTESELENDSEMDQLQAEIDEMERQLAEEVPDIQLEDIQRVEALEAHGDKLRCRLTIRNMLGAQQYQAEQFQEHEGENYTSTVIIRVLTCPRCID